jgi:hypothetical protein
VNVFAIRSICDQNRILSITTARFWPVDIAAHNALGGLEWYSSILLEDVGKRLFVDGMAVLDFVRHDCGVVRACYLPTRAPCPGDISELLGACNASRELRCRDAWWASGEGQSFGSSPPLSRPRFRLRVHLGNIVPHPGTVRHVYGMCGHLQQIKPRP